MLNFLTAAYSCIGRKHLYSSGKGYAQLHAASSGWLPCTVSPNLQNPAAISATNANTEFFKSVEEPPLPTVAPRGVSDGSGSSSRGTRTPSTPSDAHTATMSAGMLLVMVFTALLI